MIFNMPRKLRLIILITLMVANSYQEVGATFQDTDECYLNWRDALVLLKERATNSIERSFVVEQALIDTVGLEHYDAPSVKLTTIGNRTTLIDLSQKMDLVSELVLDNKRNSDLLTLAADEFREAHQTVNELRSQLSNANVLSKPLASIKTKADELDKTINNFKQDLVGVQESTPMGARELMIQNKARSQLSSLKALRELRDLSGVSDELISRIRPELERIRYGHRQMGLIAEKILNNSMQHILEDAEDPSHELQHYKERVIAMRESVVSMIDDANTQTAGAIRADEMRQSATRMSIEYLDGKASHLESNHRQLIAVALELSNRTGNEEFGMSVTSFAQSRSELLRRHSQLRDIMKESVRLIDMTRQTILTMKMDVFSLVESVNSVLLDACESSLV